MSYPRLSRAEPPQARAVSMTERYVRAQAPGPAYTHRNGDVMAATGRTWPGLGRVADVG